MFPGVIESPLKDFSNNFSPILGQHSLCVPPENVKKNPRVFLCFQGLLDALLKTLVTIFHLFLAFLDQLKR